MNPQIETVKEQDNAQPQKSRATDLLRAQLTRALVTTKIPGLGEKQKGKVRDSYLTAAGRVMITTDRISAFDRVLGTLPCKGALLNQMATFWFEEIEGKIPHHLLAVPDPNVMLIKPCTPLPVEMVVRAYLTGVTSTSAWTHYERGVRDFCGNTLPDGMRKDQQFDQPILTPSTKAEKGEHDESVSRAQILERGLVTAEEFDQMAQMSFDLFEIGTHIAARNGLILVDTKYEFGRDSEGNIIVIDEIHTPDSSRYWYANEYEERFAAGREQKKLDKEFIRSWLKEQGYTGDGEPPELTDEVRIEAACRYIEAYETVTGRTFDLEGAASEDINARIIKNLEATGVLPPQ